METIANITSYFPGVGHVQALYAASEGDEERACRYATRATGATVGFGAVVVTGGLAAPLIGGAVTGAAVAGGAGAVGAATNLATRRGIETVSWNYKDDPEVANMSNEERFTEIAIGGVAGTFAGTLPGLGKATTGTVGQGGLGAKAGAIVGDQLGLHGTSRAATKKMTACCLQQGASQATKAGAKQLGDGGSGNSSSRSKEPTKVSVSAILESRAFQQCKGRGSSWWFEVDSSRNKFIKNDIDGWRDINGFRFVVLKHAFDYSNVFVEATRSSECSDFGSTLWRAASYNPLHHVVASVVTNTLADCRFIQTIKVNGIDVKVFAA